MADSMEAALEIAAPVSKYEAALVEKGGPGPTEDKMIFVFETLDKLVPNLGVFSKVMELCRGELFEAVYSDQYTASTADNQPSQCIQRVPYFTLVKTVYDQRDERNEKLTEHLDIVKETLFNKQKQFEDLEEVSAEQADEIVRLGNKISSLQQELDARKKDVAELKATLESERQTAEDTEYQLSCDIAELREALQEAQTEASFLLQYKNGYDDLQHAFADSAVDTEDLHDVAPRKKKKPAIATRRAHLISSIEDAVKLEEQILTVQNATIEEFDKFIEGHKAELSEGMEVTEGTESVSEEEGLTYDQRERLIEQADQQLQTKQEQFKKSIDEMNTELDLLRQHRAGLQEQLQKLEENKPTLLKRKKGRHAGSGRPRTQESGVSTVPEEESEDDGGMDPFIPQERVFSKYAAMLYASDNNGRTFQEFKEAKYCPSCLEKTVMCPHKILDQEHVFNLPTNVTHIKISRPKVRINQDMMDSLMGHPAGHPDMATDAATISTDGRRIRSRVSISYQMSPYLPSRSPGDSILSEAGSGDAESVYFKNSLQRLWQDYKQRTIIERQVPRPLSMVRCISLIEQFAAYLMLSDEDPGRDSSVCSILDSVYRFLAERYLKPDVMYLAAHDFLSALVEYSPTNKVIWLFSQVLIGNLDGAVFRYVLLLGDFINQVEWKLVQDVKAFAAVVYQFLAEDDLENLQMGYTSFSENKISSTLVAEYFVYLIMKYLEPRFLDMENRLLNAVGGDADVLTEQEFLDATDAILDVPNQKLRSRLFEEAQVYVRQKEGIQDGVPVARLAQIASYLSVLSVLPVIKESAYASVLQNRDGRESDASFLARFKTSHEVPAQYKVMTLTEAKQLADNIARRGHARNARVFSEYK